MSGTYWLASYPKSGNTWMRVFLTNYWRNAETPADINQLDRTPIASARPVFEEYAGVESSDLTADEIKLARPHVYRLYAAEKTRYLKVHDAFLHLPNGDTLFPLDASLGAIYILRNPLDVAVSYAAHDGISIERVIERMAKPDVVLAKSQQDLRDQLPHYLGSWSSHTLSWVDAPLPVHVVRYEDMSYEPTATFRGVLQFLQEPDDAQRLQRAIRFSSFDELRHQEDTHGFRERTAPNDTFFRKGKVGNWREHLSDAQVARIVQDHTAVMRRFGYLTDDNQPVF